MKCVEFLSELEGRVAPVSLSDEFCKTFGAYDNSGIILDADEDIKAALFALDFSPNAVSRAAELKCNLIVTHHPAIYGGIKRVIVPQGGFSSSLAACIKRGISVISMHLNFDCAPRGIDYYLMRGIGGEREQAVMNALSSGGYGRLYEVPEHTFKEFSKRLANEFNSNRIRFYGDEDRKIKKVASFCGAGADEQAVEFAIKGGADAFVSSDMKHPILCALAERGVCVIDMPHYTSEIYGFKKIYQEFANNAGVRCEFFTDQDMI